MTKARQVPLMVPCSPVILSGPQSTQTWIRNTFPTPDSPHTCSSGCDGWSRAIVAWLQLTWKVKCHELLSSLASLYSIVGCSSSKNTHPARETCKTAHSESRCVMVAGGEKGARKTWRKRERRTIRSLTQVPKILGTPCDALGPRQQPLSAGSDGCSDIHVKTISCYEYQTETRAFITRQKK